MELRVGCLKTSLLFIACLAIFVPPVSSRGINGGMTCATCTVVTGLVEQLAQVHNDTIAAALEKMCSYLPGKFGSACVLFTEIFGPVIIELLEAKETPDVICRKISLCHTDPGQKTCNLFPLPKEGLEVASKKNTHIVRNYLLKHGLADLKFIDICKLPLLDSVCALLVKVFENHHPGQDNDKDGYSLIDTLRGASWRGKDCSDTNKHVYPGRKPIGSDVLYDSNCNGINGTDKVSGKPYEDMFCKDSGQLGIVLIGDSVGAHFHAPHEWFNPKLMTKAAFKDFGFVIENEGDWPQLSGTTGFMNSTWSVTKGPTDSVYLRMKARNRCNHRDFQNLAVNGADIFDIQNYQNSTSRNQTADNPLLIVIELVGNDVCNHYPDTLAHMTTTQQMHDNLLKTLTYLNNTAPAGSHMLILGMADGRFLYNTLHNRLHPTGLLHKDITYKVMYDWWNCMQVTPCMGWLNSNETIRNLTSKRAADLSNTMKMVATKYNYYFKNFDINYLDCPLQPVLDKWEKQHGAGSAWQLVEPVDGFHPNQLGQALTAEYVWNYLENNLPHYIGKENPHNEEIAKLFGNQGGY